jgi:regulator of nucleoside diphosphate kinase
MPNAPDLLISSRDLQRLEAVLGALPLHTPGIELLQAELDRAEVRAPQQMPANVVTMNSSVVFEIEETGERFQRTLCYPHATDKPDAVSILAPLGCALLELSIGQSIDWPLPGGKTRSVRVIDIAYQPERAGNYMQ